jgi:hypothetical protein
VYDEVPGE